MMQDHPSTVHDAVTVPCPFKEAWSWRVIGLYRFAAGITDLPWLCHIAVVVGGDEMRGTVTSVVSFARC